MVTSTGVPLDAHSMASRTCRDEKAWEAFFELSADLGLLSREDECWTVVDWKKSWFRSPSSMPEAAAERQAKSRVKKENEKLKVRIAELEERFDEDPHEETLHLQDSVGKPNTGSVAAGLEPSESADRPDGKHDLEVAGTTTNGHLRDIEAPIQLELEPPSAADTSSKMESRLNTFSATEVELSEDVTACHEVSQPVTSGHDNRSTCKNRSTCRDTTKQQEPTMAERAPPEREENSSGDVVSFENNVVFFDAESGEANFWKWSQKLFKKVSKRKWSYGESRLKTRLKDPWTKEYPDPAVWWFALSFAVQESKIQLSEGRKINCIWAYSLTFVHKYAAFACDFVARKREGRVARFSRLKDLAVAI